MMSSTTQQDWADLSTFVHSFTLQGTDNLRDSLLSEFGLDSKVCLEPHEKETIDLNSDWFQSHQFVQVLCEKSLIECSV